MKKKILSAALIIFISATTFAQKVKETDIPVAVKDAFTKRYPGIKAKWEKEGPDFEAEFDLDKVESSAIYSSNGTFKELEQEIKLSELPKNASEYCAKNYADFKLCEAEKITDASGKVMFEAEVKKGRECIEIIFDGNGNFMKKTTEKDDKK